MSPPLGLGVVLALGLVSGCGLGPSAVRAEGAGGSSSDGSTSSSDVDGSEGRTSDGGGELDPWPEGAWGPYYLASGLPIGIPGAYLGGFTNLELRPDELQIARLWCDGDQKIEQYPIDIEAGEVHVRPLPGDDYVIWNGSPLAKGIVLRRGASCAELEMEFLDPIHRESPYTVPWTWRRGAVYISTFYGDDPDDDSVCGADLSPDVPTDCEDAG